MIPTTISPSFLFFLTSTVFKLVFFACVVQTLKMQKVFATGARHSVQRQKLNIYYPLFIYLFVCLLMLFCIKILMQNKKISKLNKVEIKLFSIGICKMKQKEIISSSSLLLLLWILNTYDFLILFVQFSTSFSVFILKFHRRFLL